MTRAWKGVAIAAVIPGALGEIGTAWALEAARLPELIALDERRVATVGAPDLGWSSGGEYLLVTGYGPGREALAHVVPTDGNPALTIPNLASPRLASAPFGGRLACWQRGAPRRDGGSQFVLSIFDPRLGVCAPVPGVPPFTATSPLLWLEQPERLVVLRQQGELAALVIYDPAAGKLVPLSVTVSGLGTVLRAADRPGHVVVRAVGMDGQVGSYLIDLSTGLSSNAPEEGEAGQAVALAGAAPISGLIASCRADGLHVAAPGAQQTRRILPHEALGAHAYMPGAAVAWSPTEEFLAYALPGAAGGAADVYLVTLGLEEIACRIAYAIGDTAPAPGATVWVCMDLQRDAAGQVIEPKWSTLKAQLETTSSPLESPDGFSIRARSVGLDPDTLKRLTGLSTPPPEVADERSLRFGPAGAPPKTVMRAFTLPARGGLIAWSQAASLGKVIAVEVTRRQLLLIGNPVP